MQRRKGNSSLIRFRSGSAYRALQRAASRGAEDGFVDKRVPPPPLAAEGRLTLNT